MAPLYFFTILKLKDIRQTSFLTSSLTETENQSHSKVENHSVVLVILDQRRLVFAYSKLKEHAYINPNHRKSEYTGLCILTVKY